MISHVANRGHLSDHRAMKIVSASAAVPASTSKRVLVPTMGALHKAHGELMRAAREIAGPNGEVAVSIFVNPLQFEPGSDFDRYPRPQAEDEEFCREAGVDLLFRPAQAEMYQADQSVVVEETSLANTLEGKSRPGHFRGVCTVVAKLFHILAPDVAVFGEKDFQQLAIIRRMVRDLNFRIEIVGVPTVREADGLACSSRNRYLTDEGRMQAPVLRSAMLKAAELAKQGETSAARILFAARGVIGMAPLARIDYLELVDADTLKFIDSVRPNSLLAVAAFVGKTRLIDNIRLP
jgi:pantoate--beta-alanine ligase